MLIRLEINGLVIIDKAEAQFSSGLNVITGESGAGKSTIVKSLELLLGNKGSSDLVRSGSSEAVISGCFHISNSHLAYIFLKDLGIFTESPSEIIEVILRRKITSQGRTFCWINDVSVTLKSLKKAGDLLVDLFAQRDSSSILQESNHLDYLDVFLKKDLCKKELKKEFLAIKGSIKKIKNELCEYSDNLKNYDYIKFRLNEIQNLNPSEEDHDSLTLYCKKASRDFIFGEKLKKINAYLEKKFDQSSLVGLLKSLSQDAPERIDSKDISDKIDSVIESVDELNFTVNTKIESLDVDNYRLEESQNRLATYQSMMRKMNLQKVSDLIELKDKFNKQVEQISSTSDTLLIILEDLYKQCEKAEGLSLSLTRERLLAAGQVEIKINKELDDLEMSNSKLKVEMNVVSKVIDEFNFSILGSSKSKTLSNIWLKCVKILEKITEDGSERPRFLLQSAKASPFKSLSKIASGGEISRIILAMKAVFAKDNETHVLIFDEIDKGISGRSADKVGKKMHDLSRKLQIICISHLAQVSVYADKHFSVTKSYLRDDAYLSLNSLDSENSLNEIARLLSGEKVTKKSLENASQLKSNLKLN